MSTEIDVTNEPLVAPKSFGASLREAREKAGFSVERAAMSTRISAAFIDALENQKFKVLPGEVFGRGFVRNLCRAYGCEAKALVEAYELAVQGQLADSAQEAQRENKLKAIRYSDNRRSEFDSGQLKKSAHKVWSFMRPIALAVPIVLGAIWISQMIYQSWRSDDNKAPSSSEVAVIQAPASPAPAIVPTPIPVAEEAVAEVQPIIRGQGIESLDIIVKEPVSLRIGRDKDKQVIEVLPAQHYRFQFDEQLRLLVDDMSAVEIRFKGQVVPNKGVKGEKRYMTFAVSENTLAKKPGKPKL